MATTTIPNLDSIRLAQRAWAQTPLRQRVRLMTQLRSRIATSAQALAEIIPTDLPGSLHRTVADTLVSEVLPLAEACRFLARETESILRPRELGCTGRPVWLSGVEARIDRLPWGVVLILAPANYPLFLAGVQVLQALTAGNAVLWKPAPGTQSAAFALRALLIESGLDPSLLTLLDPAVESATLAIASGIDHLVFTGSAETGTAVLHQLADTLTPSTMELSGSDAVFILPGADTAHAIDALAFGLRFNGSATCMAPRRLFLIGFSEESADSFQTHLAAALAVQPPVPLPPRILAQLRDLVEDARIQGASLLLNGITQADQAACVTLITQATPSLLSMQTEIFAPILSVMRAANADEALAADAACPYALTAAIFAPEREAQEFLRHAGTRLRPGNILINDLILPTADPRIPFGGRGRSGFGVTRGPEGLLAMTTPRTIQTQSRRSRRFYQPTGSNHVEFFAGLIALLHGGKLRTRFAGLRRLIRAARRVK